ncbi:MAG: hypothetical protein PHO63_05720 [Bacilli bacterium]|nr:hypothetical protein [Bacilli bacterium]MDD4808937.1 hypothetical protein [Bacilli bacterium]
MSQIKIKSLLQTPEENKVIEYYLTGIKKRNKLIYKEEETDVTIEITDCLKIIRQKEDSTLTLNLDATKMTEGAYFINEIGNLSLFIKTNIIEITDHKIYTEYELTINDEELGLFIFELEFEEI